MNNQNVTGAPGQNVLAAAQAGRFVIQDYCPLAESIEWHLGQRYWRQRGNKAFIADATPVPFVINNDGTLSRDAAQVFFASLVVAEQTAALEPEIFVLELGIGVGLFARYFLDAMRDLCIRHNKDYYSRLYYVAADRSEQMLQDACRHGVFANHPGRYLLRAADALAPERDLLGDAAFRHHGPRPFRAVFLNYVLDCLPATDLKIVDGEVRQLCVRTCLARNIVLHEHTDLSAQDLARLATSQDARDQGKLLEVYGLLASEYDYHPVDIGKVPYGAFATKFAAAHTPHFLHSYGAIGCLEKLLGMVHEQGFILVNDYGQTEVSKTDDFEHQRFSQSTSVGLNFPLLKSYFAEGGKCLWVEPTEATGRIHSRLLVPISDRVGRPAPSEVSRCFQERFCKAAYDWAQEPWNLARACQKAGRFEAALGAYHEALARQSGNWFLMNEIALYLTYTLRNPAAGVEIAKVAVGLNPTCSADLWNTLGDCLFELDQVGESWHAYKRALDVNPNDIKARYNLAWVHARRRDYAAALDVIAEGLALDETGEYSERFVKKQAEILGWLHQSRQQKYFLLANRVSKKPSATLSERPSNGRLITEPQAELAKDPPIVLENEANTTME